MCEKFPIFGCGFVDLSRQIYREYVNFYKYQRDSLSPKCDGSYYLSPGQKKARDFSRAWMLAVID